MPKNTHLQHDYSYKYYCLTLISMDGRLTETHSKLRLNEVSQSSQSRIIVAFLSVSALEDNLQYSHRTSLHNTGVKKITQALVLPHIVHTHA